MMETMVSMGQGSIADVSEGSRVDNGGGVYNGGSVYDGGGVVSGGLVDNGVETVKKRILKNKSL